VTRQDQVRYAGLAVAIIGAVLIFAVGSLVGFIVMICGFLISAWSRTIV
jgi:hypothetical protein